MKDYIQPGRPVMPNFITDETRILVAYKGIRLLVNVSGKMAKWSLANVLLTFGASLGLLSWATQITNYLMLN
eukprot:TRINITY_DN5698_c0_g1_i1.p1 TRINITY_DN5698_c0_g1~~TRINITY_DN5698_c0_g1_i1.p1  ORF type:complete len:72 (+),score=5.31 TRINITY_DN5698_c0_g1_i1:308-523(+)